MSPVHVEDVAIAFYQALRKESTDYKTIILGGPKTLSWYEILHHIMQTVKKKKIVFPMPIKFMKLAASLCQWIPFFPITVDQLKMLEEGNIANSDNLRELIEKPLTSRHPESQINLAHKKTVMSIVFPDPFEVFLAIPTTFFVPGFFMISSNKIKRDWIFFQFFL